MIRSAPHFKIRLLNEHLPGDSVAAPIASFSPTFLLASLNSWRKLLKAESAITNNQLLRNPELQYYVVREFSYWFRSAQYWMRPLISDLIMNFHQIASRVTDEEFARLTSIPTRDMLFPNLSSVLRQKDRLTTSLQINYDQSLKDSDQLIKLIDQVNAKFNMPASKYQVIIYQHSWQVTDDIISGVHECYNQLTIDKNLDKPQVGFFGPSSINQIYGMIKKNTSQLITVEKNGKVLGFYASHILNYTYLNEHLDGLKAFIRMNGLATGFDALVESAGISLTAVLGYFRETKSPLNEKLSEMTMDIARQNGIKRIFGYVRAGENANLALKAHQRLGAKIYNSHLFEMNGQKYAIIYYDLCPHFESTANILHKMIKYID